MAIPTTTNLGLAKPGQGVSGWNTYHNKNYEDIDSIFGNNHGPNGHHEVITLDEQSSTPSSPTQDVEANIYLKGDTLVIQFDNGGTTRYFTLDLTATSSQQVGHSTSAP